MVLVTELIPELKKGKRAIKGDSPNDIFLIIKEDSFYLERDGKFQQYNLSVDDISSDDWSISEGAKNMNDIKLQLLKLVDKCKSITEVTQAIYYVFDGIYPGAPTEPEFNPKKEAAVSSAPPEKKVEEFVPGKFDLFSLKK